MRHIKLFNLVHCLGNTACGRGFELDINLNVLAAGPFQNLGKGGYGLAGRGSVVCQNVVLLNLCPGHIINVGTAPSA